MDNGLMKGEKTFGRQTMKNAGTLELMINVAVVALAIAVTVAA